MKNIILTTALTFCVSAHGINVYPSDDLAAAITAACASNDSRTIQLMHGTYNIENPLPPINCALNIKGDGVGSTVLLRRHQGGAFLHWVRGTDINGGSISDLIILAGVDTKAGIAILIDADLDTDNTVSSYNRHSFTVNNVLIGRESTGSEYWDNGIYLDGSKNVDGREGFAPGIRRTMITNTSVSGYKTSAFYINKGRGANLLNVDCYIPIGTTDTVLLDNSTWGVKLDSRTCSYRFMDSASNWMLYNGVRYR